MKTSEKDVLKQMHKYIQILEKLNQMGVTRTYNSPVGDYAEWLVSKKLNLTLEHNSKKGFDALDKNEKRYQIKSRWERGKTTPNSRQLNVIRNYEEKQFDFLIIVIFDGKFNVKEAYCIPHKIIGKYGKYKSHQNGYVLTVCRNLLADKNIKNITPLFK